VVEITYPDGGKVKRGYSARHLQLMEETDELGVRTRYEYDGQGNLTKRTEALGTAEERETEYEIDGQGRVVKETRKGGPVTLPGGQTIVTPDAVWGYEYDARGNRIAATDPEGRVTRTTHNRLGRILSQTDAAGNIWRQTWDAKGQRLSVETPLGAETHYTWDAAGNLAGVTDALGNATTLQYDGAGRETARTNPLGGTRTRQYDAAGRLVSETDEAGHVSHTLAYDVWGRLTQTTDAAGNLTRTQYDTGQTDALPARILYPTFTRQFTYDARGRVTRTEDATTGGTPITLVAHTVYDKKGQVIQTTDRNGRITRLTYDGLGRLKEVTDPADGQTRFTYDQADNLIAVTDARGNITRYEYDGNNQRIKETRPLGQTTQYQYDARGNLTRIQDAKGNRIDFTYDAASRRIEETHTPANASAPGRTIGYTYDEAGRLSGYSDGNTGHSDHQTHGAAYTRDALGRKTQETIVLGGQSLVIESGYAVTGQKESQTWPDGTETTYAWDAAQRLTGIQIPGAGSISATGFDAWNQVKNQLYPGGSTRLQEIDGLARPILIEVKGPGQQILLRRGYGYDNESNIIQLTSERGETQYGYDALYRLTRVETDIDGLPEEHYTYDAVGNRTTDTRKPNLNQTGEAWTYNANNQLQESATEDTGLILANSQTVTHSYDENGSLTKKSTPAGTEAQHPTDNQQYAYDAQNRLTEVQDQNGNAIASYQYDPFGRRIRKTIHRRWDTNTSTWKTLQAVETHTYFYGDEGLIAEYVRQGTQEPKLVAEYGWQPDGMWGTNPQWIRTRRQDGTGTQNEAETFYYQNDHLGTPQQVIDNQGQVVWRQTSTAFGETIVDETSTITNNLRFPGQYFDLETHTHYNFFRDYDPRVGRYVQEDPIGLVGGVNRYGYVEGNPVWLSDPKGLQTEMALGSCFLGGPANPVCDIAVITTGCKWVLAAIVTISVSSTTNDKETEKQAEHDAYHAICDKPNPYPINTCEWAKFDVNRAKACYDARKAWGDKWGWTDALKNQLKQVANQLKNAIAAQNRWCCDECQE
jgi:RHS repeat-associated protein